MMEFVIELPDGLEVGKEWRGRIREGTRKSQSLLAQVREECGKKGNGGNGENVNAFFSWGNIKKKLGKIQTDPKIIEEIAQEIFKHGFALVRYSIEKEYLVVSLEGVK